MSKEKNQSNWKFEKSGDYYTDLNMRESSNFQDSENELHWLYQMGEAALADAGYYKKAPTVNPKDGKVRIK